MERVRDSLVVTRRFRCAVETLFDAWLDAGRLRQFMCPGGTQVGRLEIVPTVGGEFLIEMMDRERPIPHRGRFLEIERPVRIGFTWSSPAAGENTLVTLSFKETNGHTVLTLQHDRLPRAQTDSHRSGWNEVLAKLSKEI